jgi:hypothetical protein
MTELLNLKTAVNDSMKLLESAGLPAALRLLEAAIERCVGQGWMSSVPTLGHHAAVLCNFAGNLPLRWHYCELSRPDSAANYRALYGLRKISLEEGQTEPARLYAQQAYDAIAARYDPLAHSWLELIEKDWPDLRHAPQP